MPDLLPIDAQSLTPAPETVAGETETPLASPVFAPAQPANPAPVSPSISPAVAHSDPGAGAGLEDAEEMPVIEPFPEPKRIKIPAIRSVTDPALRADLETLKAVLEMEMPPDEVEEPSRPVNPPLPLPKDGLPGLEGVLGGFEPGGRRRRRRGGRGRGRRGQAAEGEGNEGDVEEFEEEGGEQELLSPDASLEDSVSNSLPHVIHPDIAQDLPYPDPELYPPLEDHDPHGQL